MEFLNGIINGDFKFVFYLGILKWEFVRGF